MLIKKILQTKIDLNDPNDIFDPNIEEVCRKHLRNRYVGRCYMSCYVSRITKIIQHSNRYMVEESSGSSSVDVKFEVEGLIYTPGEVINGCHVVKIETDGRIHAKSKYAGLQIKKTANINIYKEGQLVPFVTKKVKYNPGQDSISVEASPFIPLFPENKFYKITDNLSDVDKTRIKMLLEKLNNLKEQVDNIDADKTKSRDFFQGLVYPFKKPKSFEATQMDFHMKAFNNIKGKIICLPIEMDKKKGVLYTTDTADTISEPAVVALDFLIREQIMYYETILGFVDIYDTFKKVAEYQSIWRLYNKMKGD